MSYPSHPAQLSHSLEESGRFCSTCLAVCVSSTPAGMCSLFIRALACMCVCVCVCARKQQVFWRAGQYYHSEESAGPDGISVWERALFLPPLCHLRTRCSRLWQSRVITNTEGCHLPRLSLSFRMFSSLCLFALSFLHALESVSVKACFAHVCGWVRCSFYSLCLLCNITVFLCYHAAHFFFAVTWYPQPPLRPPSTIANYSYCWVCVFATMEYHSFPLCHWLLWRLNGNLIKASFKGDVCHFYVTSTTKLKHNNSFPTGFMNNPLSGNR